MATHRTNSRGRSRDKDGIPWVALSLFTAIVLAIGGGLGWMYLRATAQNTPVDTELCPESGPGEQTIVLIDATDAIASITQTEILNKITDLASATPKGGRFELRVLEPDATRTTTLFNRCNPGDGSDLDELTGNPELAQKKWASQFGAPLAEAMRRSVNGQGADTSPIMAGIQQIAVDRLSSAHSRSISSKVIVVSDMLENSDAFSIYEAGPDFDAFRRSPGFKRYHTDLAGAGIAIWFLDREAKVASVPLMEFWVQWILENRGSPLTATRMQGMN